MKHLSSSPRSRDRVQLRRRSLFRPVLEALEDRVTPTGVPWAVDADPEGTVFVDTNANGKFDLGESGLPGWTVWLDLNRDSRLSPDEPVMTTDATGHYFFDTTNMPPALTLSDGSLIDIVRVDLQVGSSGRWLNTTSTGVIINRTTTPYAPGVDFGMTFQPTVGVAPVGPESLVNISPGGAPQDYDPTTSNFYYSSTNVSVSANPQGTYVVGWANYTNGGPETIYARVFNSDGSPRTGEITVGTANPYPGISGQVLLPTVALGGNGSFLVCWNSCDYPSSQNYSAFARVFNANGTPAGGAVALVTASSTTSGNVAGAAADANGNFAVLYIVDVRTLLKHTHTLSAQRFTANGAANGKVITVANPGLQNGAASIAMAGAGNFVVVWDEIAGPRNGNASSYVYAQRYSGSGSKSGSQITVASGTTTASGMTRASSVTMNTNGRFVVAYEVTGAPEQRRVRVYNADGTAAGAAATFASAGILDGEPAAVAMDAASNVTLAWTCNIDDNNSLRTGEVRMQGLTAAGVLEPETIVNTTTQGDQHLPGVAATGNGTFVVAWQGYGPGDDAGIFSQRYATLPAPLMAADLPTTTGSKAVTAAEAKPLLVEALRRWKLAGANTAVLGAINLQIADLGGQTLGLAQGHTITLDDNAADWGWFIDRTPRSDSEFRDGSDHGQREHMDALTVLIHEVGHLLGHEHADGGVMTESLLAGVRVVPVEPFSGWGVNLNQPNHEGRESMPFERLLAAKSALIRV